MPPGPFCCAHLPFRLDLRPFLSRPKFGFMVRRPLVAANWKMHGQRAEVGALVQALVGGLATGHPLTDRVDVLVCPSFVHLTQVGAALTGTDMLLGAQNLHQESQGAFTGEVSAPMLQDVGCRYVLVGHSERRMLYGESDALVAAKFVAAQTAGLVPVLCVGESASQREDGHTAEVVRRQLRAVISQAGAEAFARDISAVIAYEPVWAIGTGQTATPEQAQEVHALIRAELAGRGCAADAVRIVYGGSVKAANAAELFEQSDIDGALVGGASLIAAEFLAICRAAAR